METHSLVLQRITMVAGLALAVWLGTMQPGYAQTAAVEPRAEELLRTMSDYLGKLGTFSAQAESTQEVLLHTDQKIQYGNTAIFTLQRPNRLRAERTGELLAQVLYYDGAALTLYQKDCNCYATIKAPATVEETLDYAQTNLGLYAPAGDLLYRDAYAVLMEDTVSGMYLGLGEVDGVACHHLAFRGNAVDWQIWIEQGDRPLPKKFIITSKLLTGAPQFSVILKNWDLAPRPAEGFFTFTPAKDMKKIDFIDQPDQATTTR